MNAPVVPQFKPFNQFSVNLRALRASVSMLFSYTKLELKLEPRAQRNVVRSLRLIIDPGSFVDIELPDVILREKTEPEVLRKRNVRADSSIERQVRCFATDSRHLNVVAHSAGTDLNERRDGPASGHRRSAELQPAVVHPHLAL